MLSVQVPTYDASWYKAIKRPTWTPPNWVFPAVWIPLKVMQSVSLDGVRAPVAKGMLHQVARK
jgi:benzodiazapine receptor